MHEGFNVCLNINTSNKQTATFRGNHIFGYNNIPIQVHNSLQIKKSISSCSYRRSWQETSVLQSAGIHSSIAVDQSS